MPRPSPPPFARLALALLVALPLIGHATEDEDAPTYHDAPPPGWRLLAHVPGNRWTEVDANGEFAIAIVDGATILHLEPHGWMARPLAELPRPDGSPPRAVWLRDAFVRSPAEAYIYGVEQTAVAWDGTDWRIEHQDANIWSGRSNYAIYACGDTVYATDRWSTKRREADGTWTSLGRVERPCQARLDPWRIPHNIASPPDCWRHTHDQSERTAWCKAGLHVWDDATESWHRHPAPRDLDAPLARWQRGPHLLVAIGPHLDRWDGTGWTRVLATGGAPITAVIGEDAPVIRVGESLWVPDAPLIPAPTAAPAGIPAL